MKRVLLDGRLWSLAISGAIVAIGLALTPSQSGFGTHRELGFAPCSVLSATGRPCPTCGMTTSVSATLRGDFALAFRAHPLGIALALGSIAAFLMSAWALALSRPMPVAPRTRLAILFLFALSALIYGGIRFFAND